MKTIRSKMCGEKVEIDDGKVPLCVVVQPVSRKG